MESRRELRPAGLELRLWPADPEKPSFDIGPPDSDAYNMTYSFRRRGGCWVLVRMSDGAE